MATRRPLVLASGSATRADMLRRVGLSVAIDPSSVDERAIEASLGPVEPAVLASALASAKAFDVARRRPDAVVIGADQTLDCDGVLFHKPADRPGAERHLAVLAGRTHRLTSAAAIVADGKEAALIVSEARLTMRPLDAPTIERYLDAAGDDVMGSVGVYRIEDLGAALFERVDGDHFTVLGLPLLPLLSRLRSLGFIA